MYDKNQEYSNVRVDIFSMMPMTLHTMHGYVVLVRAPVCPIKPLPKCVQSC